MLKEIYKHAYVQFFPPHNGLVLCMGIIAGPGMSVVENVDAVGMLIT